MASSTLDAVCLSTEYIGYATVRSPSILREPAAPARSEHQGCVMARSNHTTPLPFLRGELGHISSRQDRSKGRWLWTQTPIDCLYRPRNLKKVSRLANAWNGGMNTHVISVPGLVCVPRTWEVAK